MHTMIDLTVYFLFFIAFSRGAVFRSKGAEDEEFHLDQLKDFLLKNDRQIIFKSSLHNVDADDDDNEEDSLISVTNSTNKGEDSQDADPWSVIWYLGAFSGLITFFLVVTCSEWCCGNHLYTRHYGANHIYANSFTHTSYRPPETPPPPYHLFAPPSYSDSVKNSQEKQKPPKKSSIFIIPIHRIRRNSTT